MYVVLEWKIDVSVFIIYVTFFINSNYMSLYIHDQGSFVFTGFESTLPNWQIGYVGAVLMIAELVSVKPKSMTRVSGYNSISL